MILSVENNLQSNPQTLWSYVTSSISSGGTAVPVRNTNAFTVNYAIQIGKTGEEQSEIVVIDAPSGTILPITASGTLRFDHPLDTPVFQIHFDKIVFKRSTTGTTGTAVALATVSITPDSLYTEYNDTTGASTYAYKTSYLDSVTGDVSADSDWFTPSGPSFYSLQKMRQRAKDALYNANYIKSDDVINDWINEWCEQMNNAAVKVNKGYSIGTASYAFGTAGYGTITDAAFKQATKIEITWDGNSYTNSYELPMNQYTESDTFSAIRPRHSWEGDTVFRVLPNGSLGTARFSFGKLNTPLVNDADELAVVLRSYTTSCINYVLFRAYANDSKPEIATQYHNLFKDGKNDFVNEITPRDQTGYKTIEHVEGLSGMNEDVSLTSDWFI